MTLGSGLDIPRSGYSTPSVDEQAAVKHVGLQAVGAVPQDVFERMPISDMIRQTVWKYSSDASKPTIPPLRSLLTAKGYADADKSWIPFFNNLIKLLPEDVRERYIAESRLPVAERDEAFADLDKLLGLAAGFMAWLTHISKPIPPDSLQAERIALYNALPNSIKEEMTKLGLEVINSSTDVLQDIGPNNLYYDIIGRFISQLSAGIHELKNQGKDGLSLLVSDVNLWSEQLRQLDLGNHLGILSSVMDVLSVVTASSAVSTGSPALLFGLSAAGVGNEAVIPQSVNTLNDLIAKGLDSTLLPKADAGSQELLKQLLDTGSLVASTMALWSLQHSPSPFFTEIGLHAALNANVLQTTCEGIATACGADEKTAPIVRDGLSAYFTMQFLQTVAAKDVDKALALTESLNSFFEAWLNGLDKMAEATKFKNIEDERIQSFLVHSEHAKRALQEHDWKEFLSTLNVLEGIGGEKNIAFNIKPLENMASTLWNQGVKGGIDEVTPPKVGVFQS